MLLEILLLSFLMCCFQDKFSSMNTPKNFVTCSLLICISSIRRLGKVCGRNCLFERGWNKDHLVLSILRDNLFDLNHVETLSSSTFIIAKVYQCFYGKEINLVQKIKLVSWSWNLLPTLIWICSIEWWCSLFLFYTRNILFVGKWSAIIVSATLREYRLWNRQLSSTLLFFLLRWVRPWIDFGHCVKNL